MQTHEFTYAILLTSALQVCFTRSDKSTKQSSEGRHHNLLSHTDLKQSITCHVLPTITVVTVIIAAQAVGAVVAAMAVVEAAEAVVAAVTVVKVAFCGGSRSSKEQR
eukprot:7360353-Ditylum_brightwellii.AAC.1